MAWTPVALIIMGRDFTGVGRLAPLSWLFGRRMWHVGI
jgi:hypothetical protein